VLKACREILGYKEREGLKVFLVFKVQVADKAQPAIREAKGL